MSAKCINVLLIEDHLGDVEILNELFQECTNVRFFIECCHRLNDGIEFLQQRSFDVILLDLSLPDSKGVATFSKLISCVKDTPIIVLTGQDDESLAIQALTRGAQDYLFKGHLNRKMIERVIRYSIERHTLKARLSASELRFKKIVDQNSDGIVIVDKEHVIQLVNPIAEYLLSQNKQPLVGQTFNFPISLNKTSQHHIETSSNEKLIIEISTGDIEWDGQDLFLVSLYDVTERKRLEETIKTAHTRENIQELAAAISHEFSQPLQILHGIFYVEEASSLSSEDIATGLKMVQRMTELMVDLRNLNQLNKQRYLDTQIIDLKKSANPPS